MSELASLQSCFASGLLGEDDTILVHLQPGRFPADAVLQIYRNNVILGLTEVLASSYPAVKVMVGEAFFAAAARGFVLAEPLREGSVMHYGEGFGDWLTRLPTTRALPWLGELARFEWMLERASLLAPESRRWPAERLAALAPDPVGATGAAPSLRSVAAREPPPRAGALADGPARRGDGQRAGCSELAGAQETARSQGGPHPPGCNLLATAARLPAGQAAG